MAIKSVQAIVNGVTTTLTYDSASRLTRLRLPLRQSPHTISQDIITEYRSSPRMRPATRLP